MRTPGYGITPDRFVRVAHLLPRQRGNVAVDNHTFVNALLWMCRTGAPWRDLPECYGKWVTVYQRFDRWSGNGATCISSSRCFVFSHVFFSGWGWCRFLGL